MRLGSSALTDSDTIESVFNLYDHFLFAIGYFFCQFELRRGSNSGCHWFKNIFSQAFGSAKPYGSSRSIVRRIASSLPLQPCPRVHFQVCV
uniref:Mitochondrial fission regulator n=1 Tax=Neogobius melanostomus TaxID=47308 RepID=A0A8C6TCB6_9GOBI